MKYRLVIFDFDGTLADSFPVGLRLADRLSDRHGLPRVDRDRLDDIRRLTTRELMKQYGVPLWKLPRLVRDARRMMGEVAGEIPLFAGVADMLARLSDAGCRLAVVTSNSRENVEQVLGPGLAARIQQFECGVGLFGKSGKFRRVLKNSGLAPGEVICIGDETRDIHAARRAKLPCAAVAWGYANPDLLRAHAPDRVFESVEELTEALLGE